MPISDGDHVSRYCSGGTLDQNNMPMARAFMDTDNCLSGNWIERLGAPCLEVAIRMVCDVLRRNMQIRQSGKIALLNVGDTKATVLRNAGTILQIEHQPRPNNESHACIRADSADKEFIAAQIYLTVKSVHGISTAASN